MGSAGNLPVPVGNLPTGMGVRVAIELFAAPVNLGMARATCYDLAMSKPTPKPIPSSELRSLALKVIQSDRFPYLATIDADQPRLRPVSPVRTDGFVVFVANLRSYHKTGEIAANPKVELCYLDDQHNQVRITGTATVVTDRSVLEEIWNTNPLLRQYLGSLDNPQLIVYRIDPNRVRYMQEWALDYYEVTWEAAASSP